MKKTLEPKLFSTLFREGYSWSLFRQDLIAGLVVAILTLPMCIGFAIASGVRPEQGFYTAIIAGFLIALLGGSAYQVSGPTGAFVVLIYGIVQKYGYDGLSIAAVMAGILILIMGLGKMGKLIHYIPYPVIIGMTTGLSLVIFMGQVPDFLGLRLPYFPPGFIDRAEVYYQSISTINLYSFGLGLLSLIIVAGFRKISTRIPGALVAILLVTSLVVIFDLPVDTLGKRFGAISSSLPTFNLPNISWDKIIELFSPAVSIALLAAMESLLSAVVADGMTETKHCPNTELTALGIGNILGIFFGGIPATAGFARTTANVKSGAKTPMAAIFHSIFLLGFLLFLGHWMFYIPTCALAALLLVVAYNMSEWRHFSKVSFSPKTDVILLFSTFLLTIFVGLTFAIQAGVIMALFFFAERMVDAVEGKFNKEKSEDDHKEDPWSIHLRDVPPEIEVFEIQGPFFFAAVEKFKNSLYRLPNAQKVLILRFRHVPIIDATALRALDDLVKYTKRQNIALVFSGVQKHVLIEIKRSGLLERLGKENVFSNIDEALEYSKKLIQKTSPNLAATQT